MTGLTPRAVASVLAPLAAGAALSAVLLATMPAVRLYATAAPGLVAAVAGLAGSAVVAAVLLSRQRIAAAGAAAAEVALTQAAATATQDRLRLLMRLDHELKNPLTAIRAGLANVEQDPALGLAAPGTAAALASVSAQADRITRLVSDLRKLSDAETQQLEVAPVDLADLLTEAVEAAQEIPGARERAIRLTVQQAPWPLPAVEGDRDLLFIALRNLLGNAVKFSAPGDTVEVRAREDAGGVLVEVADTGLGIPASEVGQVWQELARGQAARSLPGTGIGLALVRVITHRHGGTATIDSREGAGTVVSIRLPASVRALIATDVSGLRQRRHTAGKSVV